MTTTDEELVLLPTKVTSVSLTQRSRSLYIIPRATLCITLQRLRRVHDAQCSILALIVKDDDDNVDLQDDDDDRRLPIRTTLRGICRQANDIATIMRPGESLSVMKDGYACDDILALLHRPHWRAIDKRLQSSQRLDKPSAAERVAVWRAAEVLVRVIEGTRVRFHDDAQNDDDSEEDDNSSGDAAVLRNARVLELHRQLQQADDDSDESSGLGGLAADRDERLCADEFAVIDDVRASGQFSQPVPPHLMSDLLYRVSDWIAKVGRWSPTSFIYWIESKEHQLYEVTPFGISDAVLFHIDYDDGFSAPFGRDAPMGRADAVVPRHLRESFQRFKSGLSDTVLCSIH